MLLKRNKFTFNLHLILSLVAALPLFIILFSAPFLSYRAELSELFRQSQMQISPSGEPKTAEEILTALKEKTNFDALTAVNFAQSADTAWRVALVADKKQKTYLLDPATAEILGEDNGDTFTRVAMSLHRNLGLALLGMQSDTARIVGKNIVAISSVIMAILVVSGVWLYWPFIRKNFAQSLKFNPKARGYGFFYRFHASFGLWTGVLLFVMALTGLYWSYDFVRGGVNAAFGVSVTQNAAQRRETQKMSDAQIAQVAQAIDGFKSQISGGFSSASLNLRDKKGEIFVIKFTPKNGGDTQNFLIGAQNGKQEQNLTQNQTPTKPADKPAAAQNAKQNFDARSVSKLMLSIHTGEILGEAGRAIFALAVALAMAVVASGFIMTFKRVNK